MALVDEALMARLGVTHMDLADCTYYSWFETGITPQEAAEMAIDNELEDFGFVGDDFFGFDEDE